MTSSKSSDRLESAIRVLWGLVLFLLPVTSFRWLPDVMGTTEVRPLSFYPMAVLVPLLLVYLWRTRSFRFPVQTGPLLAFLLVAMISTLIGGLYAPLDLRGQTYWRWALRAWLSLGVGMSFFSISFLLSRSKSFLRTSLGWMYAGLTLTILWGFIQAIAINTSLLEVEALNAIQQSFSIRPLVLHRISGFAFEPSWLADQIVIFYFPWLFGALLTGYRLTKHAWLEPALTIGSLLTLFLTYSRSGTLGLTLAVLVVMLTVGRGILVSAWSWFWAPFVSSEIPGRNQRLLILLIIVVFLVSSVYWFNRYEYFASLWQSAGQEDIFAYINQIYAGPRLAYIYAGLDTYSEHPWTGVGLGGSAFYLLDRIPNWAHRTTYEITRQFSPDSTVIPNVRNLYVRLLSETGIVGFWLYLSFMFSILGSIRKMFISRKLLMVYVSVSGLTIWLTVMIRQFTLSTLTSPTIWLSLGMVVGYAHHLLDHPGQQDLEEQLED